MTNRRVSVNLPVEYQYSAVFIGGIYLVSYNKVVRYSSLSDTLESFEINDVLKLGENPNVLADENGEYLLFGFKKRQIIIPRHTQERLEVRLDSTPLATYIDKGKLVNLFNQGLTVYSLLDLSRKIDRPRVFTFKSDKRLSFCQLNKLSLLDNRLVLSGDMMLELTPSNILETDSTSNTKLLFAEATITYSRTTLAIKGPVLMKPEPLTFIGEEISQEVFTTWGLVVVYHTGLEVYRAQDSEYHLVYVYKTKGRVVPLRPSLFAVKHVFLQDTTQLIELQQDGPFIISSVTATEEVLSLGEHLLVLGPQPQVLSTTAPVTPLVIPDRPLPVPAEETGIRSGLITAADNILATLRKYQTLDLAIINGRPKEEQKLLLEKILNTFKADVTNKSLILALSLQEKISYLQDTATEIYTLSQAINNQTQKTDNTRQKIITRIATLISQIKETRTQLTPQTSHPAVEELRTRITALKQQVDQESTRLQRERSQIIGQLHLLKQQNAFLRRKIADLDTAE
ncbi:hypothetical protein NEHOM01_2033 [Nematocida homosporus]|uniref:uncharacterized protein n=1 Tax=Nematocida homosporus TaxID=1912981 RepID=UPI00221F23B1|nr:uncharacterized protein NEHOM01_2033 [Nematocida homosporus]KAI5187237.1 hypothetical protein NEHOM01_2033 [Nematocida homosporus]